MIKQIIHEIVKEELEGYSDIYKHHYNNYVNTSKLYEGLIITQPISVAFTRFNHTFKDIKMYKQNNNTLKVNMMPYQHRKKHTSNIIKLMNNLGWFLSDIEYFSNEGMINITSTKLLPHNTNIVNFTFEPKYILEITKLPKYIYHITLPIYVDKIKQKGLIPKTKNKKSKHNSRIYFTTNKNGIVTLSKLLYPHENTLSVVEVETNQIKNIRFIEDVNTPNGIFTLQNIPPSHINKITNLNL